MTSLIFFCFRRHLALSHQLLPLGISATMAFLSVASLRAQVPDASAALQRIGNPLTAAGYTGNSPYRSVLDLRYHFGRIYLGYGHTNQATVNRLLYADPTTMTVGAETPPNITITEEQLTHTRVFDDVLYFISYDPGSGNQYYTRTPQGVWSKIAVNDGSDHARDLYLHGSRVWYSNTAGTTNSPFPNLLSAPALSPSRAFVRQSQPNPPGFPFTNSGNFSVTFLPEAFFSFAGRLYAVAPNYINGEVPFVLRHNNNDYQPWWSVAISSPSALLDSPYRLNSFANASRHGLSQSPVEVWHNNQRCLIFSGELDSSRTAHTLFYTPDPETTKALPITLPNQASGTQIALYLIKRQGRVFAVSFRLQASNTRTLVQVHQLRPDSDPTLSSSWPALFRFTTNAMIGHVVSVRGVPLDYADGTFYFAAGVSYNPTTFDAYDPADLNGSVYRLPFAGVLGPVSSPPPELPPTEHLTYLLDNYEDRRTNPLSAVSGTTVTISDADTERPGTEAIVTRSAASASVQFLQHSIARTHPLLRAIADSGTSAKLRAWVKTFANENAGDVSLRWGIQTDAWTDVPGSTTRRYGTVTLPRNTNSEAFLDLDLAANPAIAAAAQNFMNGGGTSFRIFIDNGAGPYWSGAVRWIVDDVEVIDLPRSGPPAPDHFVPVVVSPSTVRLTWGPARAEVQGNALGWILEKRDASSAAWETLQLLGGDVGTLDVAAGENAAESEYRITPYTSFGKGTSLIASPVSPVLSGSAPGSFDVTAVSSSQINLVWATPPYDGLIGHELQRRSVPGGAWTTAATLPGQASGYSDTLLAAGSAYEYRVRSVSLAGPSPWTLVRSATTQPAAVYPLTGHWRFDESSGVTASDSSENALHLSIAGSPSWEPGKIGNAVSFSGTSGRAQVADHPQLNGMNKLTIAFWVRPTNLNGGNATTDTRFVVSKRSTSTNAVFSLFFGTGNRLFVDLATNNNRFSSNTVFANDTWYHIALIYDGTLPVAQRARLYVNGVLDVIASESNSTLTTVGVPLHIGRPDTNSTNYFDGSVDDLRIYRAALPEATLIDLMSDKPAAVVPAYGSLAHWRSSRFAADVLSNPSLEDSLWGNLATPSGDGVPNLLKYHLGLDPLTPVSDLQLPSVNVAPESQTMALVYWRDRNAKDSIGRVLWSETLATDSWHGDGVTERIVAQSDTHDKIEARVFLSDRQRLFLRLGVQPVK